MKCHHKLIYNQTDEVLKIPSVIYGSAEYLIHRGLRVHRVLEHGGRAQGQRRLGQTDDVRVAGLHGSEAGRRRRLGIARVVPQ